MGSASKKVNGIVIENKKRRKKMIRTPKFQGQLEMEEGKFLIFGGNSIKECLNLGKLYKKENFTGRMYIWGNNKAGRDYIERQGKINIEFKL